MSITKHTDEYWTNSSGSRFCSEEAAKADEDLRSSRPLKLTCSAHGVGSFSFSDISIEAVGPMNGVWGGGVPHWEVYRVYPLKDIIKMCQSYIETYGDNVGYIRQHQGCGTYGDVVVTFGPNPLHPTP